MNSLHIVAGLPASGKTTYGKRLARDLGAAFLDIDSATEPVVRAGLNLANLDPYDRDSPTFKDAFRIPIYDTLFQVARENLPHTDVVLTGPFTSELRDPNWKVRLETDFQTSVEIHYVSCSPETRQQRMQRRGEQRDLAKLADWENHLAYYENAPLPACPHRHMDTTQT